jgi:Flp pilus assembly protein TadB
VLSVVTAVVVALAGLGVWEARRIHRPPVRHLGERPRRWGRLHVVTPGTWLRRAPSTTGELADGVAAVARAVRGGTSLPQAIVERSVVPDATGRLLSPLALDLAHGRSLVDACAAWAPPSSGDARLVASSLAMIARTGGPAARALDALSDSVRERHHLAEEVRAQSAQARLSAVVVASLPAVFTAWAALVDPHSVSFLVTKPLGLACLTAGLALESLGGWWMARLVRRIW